MYLYSFGGFPFDADMNPTVNSEAGHRAIEIYLRDKEVAFPDSPSWGTSQMIPHIAAGDVCRLPVLGRPDQALRKPGEIEDRGQMALRAGAGRRGQRQAAVPRRRHAGRVLVVNRHSPRKAAAAYMACWLGTEKASVQMVSDRVNTFHDAWTVQEMTDPARPGGLHPGRRSRRSRRTSRSPPPTSI